LSPARLPIPPPRLSAENAPKRIRRFPSSATATTGVWHPVPKNEAVAGETKADYPRSASALQAEAAAGIAFAAEAGHDGSGRLAHNLAIAICGNVHDQHRIPFHFACRGAHSGHWRHLHRVHRTDPGSRGERYAALGCTAGIVPHLLATTLGLAAVMHTSALAFQALKFAGVAYLFYLAYATWRDKSAFAVDGRQPKASASGLMIKAFLLNILNPKLTIFFLAFLPQFIEPGSGQPLAQLLLLCAVFMAMTFVVFAVYGIAAHAFRKLVIESARVQRWLRYGFAAAFAGLGAKLAASEG
jgi:threonine/homoserine/homoserine lactone efflux protein